MAAARQNFRLAVRGYRDLVGEEPERRQPGLATVVTYGASVTQILRALNGKVEGFDDWWAPHSAVLSGDDGFKRLRDMRNEVLKEGRIDTGRFFHVKSFGSSDIPPNPPPGARGFFLGDEHGRSGWEIMGPDGEMTREFVTMSEDIAVHKLLVRHKSGRTEEAGELAQRYIHALNAVLRSAERKWPSPI